jgi:murein DD-endopeptidase MepM/ murein hydrolase activator NlpD
MAKISDLFTKKIKNKYRLIIRNDDNLRERISVILTPLNVILITSGLFVVVSTFVILLLIYSPFIKDLPGVNQIQNTEEIRALQQQLDSFESKNAQQLQKDSSIIRILKGEQAPNDIQHDVDSLSGQETSSWKKNMGESEQDLRLKYASTETEFLGSMNEDAAKLLLFAPLKGVLADSFNVKSGHFAIDITSYQNASIKAVKDGTVIFSSWTPANGHVLILQHPDNLLSVYKHNSVLLKKEGNFVDAGEVIALIGNSGDLSSGPHLHFELWQNGYALNPENYITF